MSLTMSTLPGASECSGSRFVIFSLPRSGSTTLAQLLDSHKDIRCLIEPFHPKRYGGKYHALATSAHSLDSTLDFIWKTWNGIKHVWESSGWPFLDKPELNERIASGPGRKIIFMIRRNLLRRFVSNYISRHTKYWIGTRAEFYVRLQQVQLRSLNPEAVRRQLALDRSAVERSLQSLADAKAQVMPLYYEDFYRDGADVDERLEMVNSILGFLEFAPISRETFVDEWQKHFDPDINRWASPEVYRCIPGIDRIEDEIGSDETGWLFR